jgi:hypothetical protein
LTMQGPSSYPKDDALRTAQVKRRGRERESTSKTIIRQCLSN